MGFHERILMAWDAHSLLNYIKIQVMAMSDKNQRKFFTLLKAWIKEEGG